MTALRLGLDSSALDAALADLSAALAELGDLPCEVADLLLHLLGVPEKLIRLDLDRAPASAAGESRITANPADGLLGLVAALRTRDFDLGAIEGIVGHIESPSSVGCPMVTEPPAGASPAGGKVPDFPDDDCFTNADLVTSGKGRES